jgi:hypothetical protein
MNERPRSSPCDYSMSTVPRVHFTAPHVHLPPFSCSVICFGLNSFYQNLNHALLARSSKSVRRYSSLTRSTSAAHSIVTNVTRPESQSAGTLSRHASSTTHPKQRLSDQNSMKNQHILPHAISKEHRRQAQPSLSLSQTNPVTLNFHHLPQIEL